MRAEKQILTTSNNTTIPTKPITQLAHHNGPVHVVQFSKCGTYCFTGDSTMVRLWNPLRYDVASQSSQSNDTMTTSHPHKVSSSSKLVRSSNTTTTSTTIGTKIKNLPHALPIQVYSDGHTQGITAMDVDDTSTTLLSASGKNFIITDVISCTMKRRIQDHTGRINTVATMSNGNLYLSGSYDGTVRIYDGKSSHHSKPIQILRDASDSISCIRILDNNTNDNETNIITTSIDGCMRTYDIRRGLLKIDNFGKDVALTCVCPTNTDQLCCAVSSLHGTIYLMERSTGHIVNTYSGGHTFGKYSIDCTITSDNQCIVSGSEDGKVVFYHLESGRIVQTLLGHTMPVCSVSCYPSLVHDDENAVQNKGSLTITASYDGNAIVWSNSTVQVYD